MSNAATRQYDDEEFERRVQNLREFDLTPVTERLRYKKGVENAEELEKKFKRFAKLLLEDPTRPAAPHEDLDQYWHMLILDTYRYEKFREEVFGTFLHHTPGQPGLRNVDDYKERVENGEFDEADAFCHARVEQQESDAES